MTMKEPTLVAFCSAAPIEALSRPIDNGHEINVQNDPQSNVARFVDHASGGLKAGTWDCSAGSWEGPASAVDEVFTVIEGSVTVGCGSGALYHLKAGDSLYIPRGAKTTWKVDHYVKKCFVIMPTLSD